MNLNVIRTLTMRAKTEGVPESTADLNKLKAAHEGVAKVTETSAKGQLSLADAVSKAERRFNASLRAQQDFEKVQRQMNMAVAQNPALQERAIAVLALARTHFDRAAQGSQAYGAAMQAASAQAQAFAGRIGPLGGVLTAVGPAGLVAAAGIGAVIIGLHQMVKAANDLADRAGKMVDFAESTGLSTTALQALKKAGAEVGLDADKISTSFERFSIQLDDVRKNTGGLAEALNRIDPALTREMATARDLGEAWDALNKARERAATLEQKNALSRATFGRGGVGMGRLQDASIDAGGLAGLVGGMNHLNVLTEQQLKRWDELGDKISVTSRAAKDNISSIFSEDVLRAQLTFWQYIEKISQEMRRIQPLMVRPSGAASFDESGFSGYGRNNVVPLSAARPRELDPRFQAAELRKQIAAMGEAATFADKFRLAEMELSIASKEAGLSAEQQAKSNNALRLSFDQQQLQGRISLLGNMATVEEQVVATANAIAVARARGVQITNEESAAIINRTRLLAEAATAEGRMRDERESLFKSQTEQSIDKVLMRNGIPPESERGKVIRDYMRMTSLLGDIQNAAGDALSGFAKDIANGVKPMDALLSQAKRLNEIFIDIAAKKLVAAAMGSLFGGAMDTAGATAGATASAGILTTAGTALAASMVAGATQAAGILGVSVPAAAATLPAAGAVTGAEVATGGAVGGAALAAGGTAAGAAIWGPIALLMAAIAIGVSMFGGGADAERQEQQRIRALHNRESLARLDTETREGMLAKFDMEAELERTSLPNEGKTPQSWTNFLTFGMFGDPGGDPTKEAVALEKTLAAERLRVIEDFNKRAIETERQRVDAAKQMRDDAIAMLDDIELSDVAQRMVDITTASSDLTKALDVLKAATVGNLDAQLAELRLRQRAELGNFSGQSDGGFVDLTEKHQREELQLREEFNRTMLSEAQKAAADQIDVAAKTAAAIAKLRASFADDLNRQLNAATGKGFLNEFTDLFKQVEQMRKDAAQLGGGQDSMIDRILGARAQSIIDDAGLVGDAFQDLLRTFPNLTGMVHEATEAIENQAEEQRRLAEQTNASARSIVDWLSGLFTGSESPLAPRARMAAARSAFDKTDVLAQGGNIDALNRWTKDAEALRSATQAMFGSAGPYQALLAELRDRGVSLPAVATSTDPIVAALRDVVLAVQLTTGAVNSNPANIATALSGYFDKLDSNGDGQLSRLELISDKTGAIPANIATELSGYFDRLDSNGDGQLSKLELIAGETGATVSRLITSNAIAEQIEARALETRKQIEASNSLLNTSNELLYTIRELSQAIRDFSNSQVGLLVDIKTLTGTSIDQLALLRSQFLNAAVTVPGRGTVIQDSGLVTVPAAVVNNSALAALNKIVYNTKQIADSVRQGIWPPSSTVDVIPNSGTAGVYAQGGWVDGNLHANGGTSINAERGEYVINRFAADALRPFMADINRGRLPVIPMAGNDNGATVAELRAMHRTMGLLLSRIAELEGKNVEATERNTEATAEQTDELGREQRFAARKQNAA